MKISTKGRYGLLALVDLAIHGKEEHVALAHIAERQGISVQYLEQVFATLRKAGILKSVKGSKGGYTLGIKAEELTTADVLRALEGELSIMESIKTDHQNPSDYYSQAICCCLWEPLDALTLKHLQSVTIADLVEKAERLGSKSRNQDMFYI